VKKHVTRKSTKKSVSKKSGDSTGSAAVKK
jgi:hypothetical protein